MSVNMFEGARRIMKLILAIIALIGIYAALDSSPAIKLVYEIPFVGVKPVQVNSDSCNSLDDAEKSSYKTTAKGNDYELMLCFKASPNDAGEMIIPFENHVSNKNIKGEVKSTSQQGDFDPDAYLAEKQAQKSQGQEPKINELEVVRDEPHKIVHSDKPLESDPIVKPAKNALENNPIDYEAIAKKFGGTESPVDYEAIAKEFGGTVRPTDYDAMAKKNSGKSIDTQTTKYTWSGGGKYDDKVIQYTKLVSSNFSVSAKDEQFVNKQYWPKKVKATLMPIGITVLSICGFFIFCWIIGWVVRGFTGISMGQDRKN